MKILFYSFYFKIENFIHCVTIRIICEMQSFLSENCFYTEFVQCSGSS